MQCWCLHDYNTGSLCHSRPTDQIREYKILLQPSKAVPMWDMLSTMTPLHISSNHRNGYNASITPVPCLQPVTTSAHCHCVSILSMHQNFVTTVTYAVTVSANCYCVICIATCSDRKYHCCHSVNQSPNSTHSTQNHCTSEATPSFRGWRGWCTRQYVL